MYLSLTDINQKLLFKLLQIHSLIIMYFFLQITLVKTLILSFVELSFF